MRLRLVTTVILTTVALAGCTAATPQDGSAADIVELAAEELGTLPGVTAVTGSQNPADPTRPGDPLDADDWVISIDVAVADDATPSQVADAAEATRDFAEQYAGADGSLAEITSGAPVFDAEADMTLPQKMRFGVYPDPWRAPAETAEAVLAVRALPSVQTVVIVGDLPYVTVADAAGFVDAFAGLHGLALWEGGGRVATTDGRLRAMSVPERQTDVAIQTIGTTAAAYPDAQFWLEAPAAGPRWPELYIDGVTPEQSAAIASVFLDPDLANAANYPLPFNIRASTADGVSDAYGTFGNVPE